jgi:copper(I)-binding protein
MRRCDRRQRRIPAITPYQIGEDAMTRATVVTSTMDAPRIRMRAAVLFLALVSLLAVISGARADNDVMVENQWMRFIIKSRPAGGYFTVHNNTASQIELTGASSSACGMIMLHQTKGVGGVEKMLPVKEVSVPAHGSVSFAPGGYHLMCMQPKDTMLVDHDVPVTLKFHGTKPVTVAFPVKGAGGK